MENSSRDQTLGPGLSTSDSQLLLGNVTLSSLARRYGTPLFVFSSLQIRENVEQVRTRFRKHLANAELFYASKANSNLEILHVIRGTGVSVEVSSDGEIFLALMAGFKPNQIVFNGPAKTRRELELAVKLGIKTINLDSIDELDRLISICRRLGRKANISFRVLPYVRAGASIIQTGIHESKFGVDYEKVNDAYRRATELPELVKPVGISGHIGSQNTDAASWRDFALRLGHKFCEVNEQLGADLELLDLGGGLPVRYARDEMHQPMPKYFHPTVSDEDIAIAIAEGLESIHCHPSRVMIEPGRRIVANSAVLLTRIIGSKERPKEKWLYLEVGFNVTPSSRIVRWYNHILPAEKMDKPCDTAYRLGGPLCDSADVYHDWEGELAGNPQLPQHRLLPADLKDGDLLAMLDVGAYNLDIMNHFNGRLLPGAVMLDARGRAKLIRKPETYRDLLTLEPHSGRRLKEVLARTKAR